MSDKQQGNHATSAMQRLTPRHLAFAQLVGRDKLSMTKAYLQLYNASYDTAKANGCRLAKKPDIKAVIDSYSLANIARAEIAQHEDLLTKHRALQLLTQIAETSEEDTTRITAIRETAALQPGWRAPVTTATLDLNKLVDQLEPPAPGYGWADEAVDV